jgi:hypothetical protein
MFIRWERRQRYVRGNRTRHGYESVPIDKWTRCAVLLESVRTPAGPRQQYVCYLGSVKEGSEGGDLDRWRFWMAAVRNLRKVGVSGRDLVRVVAALDAVVPRPDGWGESDWDERGEWRRDD